MGNKKGLSDIVITLLIVVLSLVAIGGVWLVVRNVLSKGGQQSDSAAACLAVAIDATKVVCTSTGTNKACNVTLAKTGSDAISGVKLVFKNLATGVQSTEAIDSPNDVPEIVGRTAIISDTKVLSTNALDTVDVIPYFTDPSGNVISCSQKTSFKFVAA